MTQADSPQDRQQGCLDFLSARLVQHRAAGSNRQRVKSKGANMTIGKQLLLTASVSLLLLVTTAAAQTTAFTYQGKLTDSGNLATGNYDLQFKLFDALSAGTQLGTTQTISNVTVTNGIFTCTPPTFATVTGDQSEAMILVDWNGGADSARRLICYLDSVNYANLPVTPNGSSIGVTLPAGGIFQI